MRDGYNVVAFDLPGHGRSKGEPEEWSFDYAAAVVARLIEDASSTPVHLVGISFGGMIGDPRGDMDLDGGTEYPWQTG